MLHRRINPACPLLTSVARPYFLALPVPLGQSVNPTFFITTATMLSCTWPNGRMNFVNGHGATFRICFPPRLRRYPYSLLTVNFFSSGTVVSYYRIGISFYI